MPNLSFATRGIAFNYVCVSEFTGNQRKNYYTAQTFVLNTFWPIGVIITGNLFIKASR